MAEPQPSHDHPRPQQRSAIYWLASDTGVLIKRSLTHITRSLDQMLAMVFQPIMFLMLFRYVFGGAIDTGDVSYVNFLVAGILVQNAAFGATTTALGVCTDFQKGIIDRFRSLPMHSSVVLNGHIVADLVRNTISTMVMVAVGLLIGFRPTADFGEWVLVLAILLLFTLALSWLSAIMGMVVKTIEGVQWVSFIVIFPLTFASSAFVPTDSMPTGLRLFAENQPVTHVIEAIRALMVGTPVGNHAAMAVIWCVGLLVLAIPLASSIFRRYSSR